MGAMKVSTAYYRSPIGWIEIRSNGKEIIALSFVAKPRQSVPKNPLFRKALREIGEYFNGRRERFTFKSSAQGTRFQKKVWAQLQKIGFGETVSYQEIALRIGQPKAVRAAASAIGRNPAAIVVPCHRVIASSGAVGGYAGGVRRKRWLLEHEKEPKK